MLDKVKPGLPDMLVATYLVVIDYFIYNTDSVRLGSMNDIYEGSNKEQLRGAR